MSAPALVPFDTYVPGYGHVVGVTTQGDERYYFLFDAYGVVSLIDESTVRAALRSEAA